MAQSIASILENIKKNFSQTTVVSSVTTRNDIKLHSADIPYLKTVRWFSTKAKNKKCYLTKEDWPIWLERFGGKAVHYRKQKARWAKMRALGFVRTSRCNGNRNKELDHVITQQGLEALRAFELKVYEKSNRKAFDNPSTRVPRVLDESFTRYKNGPSKTQKRPFENEKTALPLSSEINEDKKKRDFDYFSEEKTEIEANYSPDERKRITQNARERIKMFLR